MGLSHVSLAYLSTVVYFDVRALVVAHKLDKGFLPSLGHPALPLRTIVVDKTDVEDFSSIVITAVR